METLLLALACALLILNTIQAWRHANAIEDMRHEAADAYTVTWALLDELLEDEPTGVAVAAPADCNDYAYTPVPLYDGQGWHTGDRGHA